MSALDSFYNKIIARIGLLSEFLGMTTPLEMGEIGFTEDEQAFYVGNGSSQPAKVLTDKSTGSFDYTNADIITMPGGLTFNKNNPGEIGGVDLATINNQNGLIVRTGNNKFSSSQVVSNDDSLVIENGNGTLGDIDVGLNLNNPALLNLINNSKSSVYIGTVPPANVPGGSVFWDTDEDIGYMLIITNSSSAWVDFTS